MPQQGYFTLGENDQQREKQSQSCTDAQRIHLFDEAGDGDDADDVSADGSGQCIRWKSFGFEERDAHGVGIADYGINGNDLCTHVQKDRNSTKDEVREIKNAFFIGIGRSEFFRF